MTRDNAPASDRSVSKTNYLRIHVFPVAVNPHFTFFALLPHINYTYHTTSLHPVHRFLSLIYVVYRSKQTNDVQSH